MAIKFFWSVIDYMSTMSSDVGYSNIYCAPSIAACMSDSFEFTFETWVIHNPLEYLTIICDSSEYKTTLYR